MFKFKQLFLIGLFALPLSVNAELSCQNKNFTWSDTKPTINLKHIFCGESHRGRNKGFHSNYLLSSSSVVSSIAKKKSLRGGIYSARVKFKNGKDKFSTFFPDHCNVATITRSIIYAATHSTGRHPQWGVLGKSAPEADSAGYCLQTNGKAFTIRMGLIKRGTRVNTAFPQP
jgi:hypothetical protein